MDDQLRQLTRELAVNGAVAEGVVAAAEQRLGYRFPSPYREFLVATNGGEGEVGAEGWVCFDSVDELLQANDAAHDPGMSGLFDGLVLFAGNGAGEAYCFDSADRVWRANWISRRDDHMLLGDFMDFIRAQADGAWNPRARV